MHGPTDFDAILRATLEDRQLSRSERSALAALIAEGRLRDDQRAALRNQAFALAKEAAGTRSATELVDWLEEVVRTVTPTPQAVRSAAPQAFFSPGDACWRKIVALCEGAAHRVDACVFTITDDRIANAMVAAHRRGVKVRLVSDDMKSGDLGSDIGRLAHAGIPVRLDRTEAHMHHKFALFDGRLLLNGSYNWTRSACTENRENCVVSTDVKLITSFAAEMERVWDAGAPY